MPSASPETLECPDRAPGRDLRKRVAAALSAGKLVAMPTETVYGVAARADSPEGLLALRSLKGSDPARPLTWHVASARALEHFDELAPLATRLAERYWPGPLTLVLRGVPPGLEGVASDGWTGVRLPAQFGTVGLLEALEFPVVMSSANLAGGAPLSSAEAVATELGEGLELVLDGGPPRLQEASAVLALGRGRFELLRAGLHSLADLQRSAGRRIAFVCTGNTCRSPMAEGLARALLSERLGLDGESSLELGDFGFSVGSMGVAAGFGSPASGHAVEILRERGIDLTGHASRPALDAELAELDEVYCLTRSHLEALRAVLPPGRDRHLALLDPEGADVPDPIGGSRSVYRECAAAIEKSLRARLDGWA